MNENVLVLIHLENISFKTKTHFDVGKQNAHVLHVIDEQLLELGVWLRGSISAVHLLADVIIDKHW